MRIVTLASGSSGNCTLISCAGEHILIDAGISMRRIASGLLRLGLVPDDIGGVLITHEHSDHISGLSTMLKKHNIPLYTTEKVASALRRLVPGTGDGLFEIRAGNAFSLCGMEIVPFRTPHDTLESVGYRIKGDVAVGFCTDLGHVSGEVLEGLKGVEAAVVECNHDEDMLRMGPYPYMLKRRILSDRGHLSNRVCGRLAAFLAGEGARSLILAHLSEENNLPELAEGAVASELMAGGFEAGRDIYVAAAPVSEPLCLSLGEESACLASG